MKLSSSWILKPVLKCTIETQEFQFPNILDCRKVCNVTVSLCIDVGGSIYTSRVLLYMSVNKLLFQIRYLLPKVSFTRQNTTTSLK